MYKTNIILIFFFQNRACRAFSCYNDRMKNYPEITGGDRIIKEVVFALENSMNKGRCGRLENRRYSDSFVFVLSGETHYAFSDYELTATAGQILYLSKNAGYEMEILSDAYRGVYVDFFFTGDGDEVRKCALFRPGNKSETESVFRKLLNLWITDGAAARLKLTSLAYLIYADCVGSAENHSSKSAARKIKPAYDYILANYNKNLKGEPGAMCGITETHFRRLFKKACGISPVRFINKIRVERAEGLLISSNLTLAQIAEIVGYSDVYYFCKQFKKTTGVAPGAFKRSHSRQ